MNIDVYRNFVQIVEEGSISAAARKVLIAQPALSSQMKSLEQTIGAKLFIRGAQKISVTDAGMILYRRAKDMLAIEDAALKEVSDCAKGRIGTLRLGMSLVSPDPFINNLLLEFHQSYPDITYEIYEANADPLAELLQKKIIDVAIIRSKKYTYPLLKPVITLNEKITAVYHKSTNWFDSEETISIEKFNDIPISTTKGYRKIVNEVFLRAGITPNFFSVSSSRKCALMWAQNQCAAAILPALSCHKTNIDGLIWKPIGDGTLATVRCFMTLRDARLSKVSQMFLEHCRAFLRNHTNINYSITE